MFTRYGKSWCPYCYRCLETRGGLLYGSFSGPYNTIEGDVGAYNTVCVRVAAEYCFVQGMVPDTVVLTCEPCLAFLRMSSGSTERASSVGGLQSALSVPVGEERWAGFLRTRVGDAGSESEVVFWARPSDRRGCP